MPLAKLADRAEIRVAQPSHRHKVDALLAGPINPPRRVDPLAVGIKQKCRHHPRMVGRITPLLVVLRENRPQIQSLANRLPDKCAMCPGGTKSCTEAGNSHTSSTSHARKTLLIPSSGSNYPPPVHRIFCHYTDRLLER